eukprot:3539399-Rhodomonas_salina.1
MMRRRHSLSSFSTLAVPALLTAQASILSSQHAQGDAILCGHAEREEESLVVAYISFSRIDYSVALLFFCNRMGFKLAKQVGGNLVWSVERDRDNRNQTSASRKNGEQSICK